MGEERLGFNTGTILGLLLLEREVGLDEYLGTASKETRPQGESRTKGHLHGSSAGSPFRQRCKTGDRCLSERPDLVKVGRVLVSL